VSAPTAAHVAALAALPEVGPRRLSALLALGDPAAVLADVAAGRLAVGPDLAAACDRADLRSLLDAWRARAASIDVEALHDAHRAAGVDVLTADDARWPSAFLHDPDPPAVLFTRGDLELLADDASDLPGPSASARPRRVAVVGTRRCSRYGWDVAHRLGRELAAAGVVVVSGLARGIDGAAHRGVVDAADAVAPRAAAGPVGIVGTGLDVVYPRDARALWHDVARLGLLVSEAPLGTRPSRWRFPARNRLIAAVADAVVVVESAAAGGALHTVDEALARDRAVLAVPGPITSAASVGTNRLLAESAAPVCDVDDVLAAVGLAPRAARPEALATPTPADPTLRMLLDAVGWTVASLDAVAARARLPLGEVAAGLAALERDGCITSTGTGWVRAVCDSGITR
jgi:DNA processing protein